MHLMTIHNSSPGLIQGQVVWNFWWIKWYWGKFLPSAPSTFVYHLGAIQEANYCKRTMYDHKCGNGQTDVHLCHRKLQSNATHTKKKKLATDWPI
jgi:hypothetical protein